MTASEALAAIQKRLDKHDAEHLAGTYTVADFVNGVRAVLGSRVTLEEPQRGHALILNDYQVANLRAAIEACGYATWQESWFRKNPLQALHNGDWMGELYLMLPKVKHAPNDTPQQLILKSESFSRCAEPTQESVEEVAK